MAIIPPSASLRLGTWRNVFVMIDQGQYVTAEYSAAERAFREHAARCGGKAAIVTVIPSGAKQPPAESQRAISAAVDRMSPLLDGFVWVVEGTGFHNAMIRATLTTISLARRLRYPTRVSSTVTEGLAWIVSRNEVPPNVSLNEGIALVDTLRSLEPPASTTRLRSAETPSFWRSAS